MSDYKHTLNLPHTDFPMKANLPQREPAQLAFWQEMDLYAQLRKLNKGKEKFIMHDGPPYANGSIHLGHAVNKVLKDIVVKSYAFSGYDTPFVPGWDCHGLPIELNVEKKLGKPGKNISAQQFRDACREYAQSQVDVQREQFKRLGVIADWDRPYLTMAYTSEANIIRTLGKIIEKGHLHKGYKPVHWCVDCGSALAEAEVEYQDKRSRSIDVAFAILNKANFLQRVDYQGSAIQSDINVLIWTTTPWTLPANQAVALSPDIQYALVSCHGEQGDYYVCLAETLVESAMQRYQMTDYKVLATFPGKALEGLLLQHPFYDRQVPIILGDHVTVDAGTGAVHTAPAHGQEDYAVALRYDLPVDNPVGDNGCFLSGVPIFAGQHVNQANDHIVTLLDEKTKLLSAETIQHSYPHCWRHKTPLIFRATPQWFVSMEQKGLRQQALKSILDVHWMPEWGQARITGMIEQRPDWCISRQRIWSTPIVLFFHKDSGEIHPRSLEIIEQIAQKVEQGGMDVWFNLSREDVLGAEASDYIKSTDTLDVWFDSGASYAFVLSQHPDLQFPADLYLEGSDQHRGWFHTSLLSSVAVHGRAPYKAVLTHGFTVDEKGRKMSKSLGNVIAPEKVIQNLGADVLRLWIAATDYRTEMTVSDEILKRNADAYRRIRNTARFFLANLAEFDPAQHSVPTDKLLALDRWVIERAACLQQEIITAYESYQYHVVVQKIHNFCTIDMGSFYLDIIKDRQYTTQANSVARRSAQTALYHLVRAFTIWIAPILSFTAEELWQYIPGKKTSSVFFNTWYSGFAEIHTDRIMDQAFWAQLMQVRNIVNKELEIRRGRGELGAPLDAEITLYADGNLLQQLQALKDELRFVFITSAAQVKPLADAPAEAITTELENLKLHVIVSPHTKCVRCWHHRPDVGQHSEHPELCGRCVENIDGQGEQRYYA